MNPAIIKAAADHGLSGLILIGVGYFLIRVWIPTYQEQMTALSTAIKSLGDRMEKAIEAQSERIEAASLRFEARLRRNTIPVVIPVEHERSGSHGKS